MTDSVANIRFLSLLMLLTDFSSQALAPILLSCLQHKLNGIKYRRYRSPTSLSAIYHVPDRFERHRLTFVVNNIAVTI